MSFIYIFSPFFPVFNRAFTRCVAFTRIEDLETASDDVTN